MGKTMKKKILVIGGTRFFGIPMIRKLLADGHHVTVATRGNRGDDFGDLVERIIMDRGDAESMRNALAERHFDVVIDKIAYCSNDIRALMDIIDCDYYVYMSTTAVYRPKHMDTVEEDFNGATEELVWCDRADFPYDEVKRQAECALCQCYGDRNWIAVRYPFVIGQDDYTNRLLFYVEHVMKSQPMYIDNIDAQMGFIRSDEAGEFLAYLAGADDVTYSGDCPGDQGVMDPASRFSVKAVNGCSAGTISLREIIDYVEKKTHTQAVLDSSGDPAPYNGEPSYSINRDRAQKLGFQFTRLHDWIYELIDYYIEIVEKKEIFAHFLPEREILSVKPHGSGHINHTFLVTTEDGRKFILQKINTEIFRNTDELMENIVNVTAYLREKIIRAGGDPERETMTVIPTATGTSYYADAQGQDWRVYLCIEHITTLDRVERKEDFYENGRAFGNFQAMLADYPAETLHETIPDFHNTPKRYQDFERAVEQDVCRRADSVAEEINFIRAHRDEMSVLTDMQKRGELPLRITHNDTKLNNILLDEQSHAAVCIVDLDTIMPGLCAYDFGDAIRFGASTAAEDEPDVSKVSLSLELYEAYAQGYLAGCGTSLTEKEIETLPMGAKIITLEQGMRFLTDYLQGDVYYHTEREGQNLDRCRTQLALVADMERKWEQMEISYKKIYK